WFFSAGVVAAGTFVLAIFRNPFGHLAVGSGSVFVPAGDRHRIGEHVVFAAVGNGLSRTVAPCPQHVVVRCRRIRAHRLGVVCLDASVRLERFVPTDGGRPAPCAGVGRRDGGLDGPRPRRSSAVFAASGTHLFWRQRACLVAGTRRVDDGTTGARSGPVLEKQPPVGYFSLIDHSSIMESRTVDNIAARRWMSISGGFAFVCKGQG